jgi:uncharacterized membrane protein YphA (DoxX/SURF4 family)
MNKTYPKSLNIIIRIVIGLVFEISAIFKLISIDSFEVYIYSFGILSLNFSFLLARFIISIELFAGILLVMGCYLKKVIIASILTLSGFCIFILILLLTNNKDHCHCFGDIVELSHFSSILKNIFLIALLIIIYNNPQVKNKYCKLILLISIAISLALPFIISPPDSFMFEKYSKNINYNETRLSDFINNNVQISEGKSVICFFGSSCRFCKLAAQKISVIATKTNKKDLITYVFWGSEESVASFFEETNSHIFRYLKLDTDIFLKTTNGNMPLIFLLENGNSIKCFGYRDLDENEIIKFLND